MTLYVIQALNALSFSVLLLLLAAGLTLVLNLMHFVNLTHGSFYLLGSYIAITWLAAGWPWWLAAPAAFVATAAAGMLLDRFPFGRFYARTHLMQVLLTYGLMIVFADLMRWGFGAEILSPQLPPALSGAVFIGGVPFPVYRLALTAAGLTLALALWWLTSRTLWGAVVRACVSDRGVVESLGINTRHVFTLAMMLAAGLGGLSGALGAGMLSAWPGLDEEVLLLALLVVISGGLGSFAGTVAGALLLGFATTFARMWWPEFANVAIYGCILTLLMCCPRGLCGQRLREV